VELTDAEFAAGSLRVVSYARPAKLFTANEGLISAQVGRLRREALGHVISAVTALLAASLPG